MTPLVSLADPGRNAEKAADLVKEAEKQGVSLVVFPQLSLTGCSCGSLFNSQALGCQTQKAVLWLANELKGVNVCCIVGVIIKKFSRIFNCAAIIFNGKIHGFVVNLQGFGGSCSQLDCFLQPKEFAEFKISLGGCCVPVSSRLLFEVDDAVVGVQFGLNCGGLQQEFACSGVNVVCCLLAQQFDCLAVDHSLNLAKSLSKNLNCVVVAANAGLNESTTDGIYEGYCLFAQNGHLIKFAKQTGFKTVCLSCDVDVTQRQINLNNGLIGGTGYGLFETLNLNFISNDFEIKRKISKTPYLKKSAVGLSLQCAKVFKIQALALARRVRHVNAQKLIVGVSGGLDSTLAVLVAVEVCRILNKHKSFVLAVSMPGFGTSAQSLKNAQNLAYFLGTDFKQIPIISACRQHFFDISHKPTDLNVTFENAQARERTQILFDLANDLNGLVVGTSDLSEIALGFATFGGDHLAHYNVNCGLFKTMIRKIVEFKANVCSKPLSRVLFNVLNMPISPELIKNNSSCCVNDVEQKTEEILGPYILHDFFLFYFINFGFSVDKIKFLSHMAFGNMFSENKINKTLETFFNRFCAQQFKRSCSPDGVKLMGFSLSPRAGFKMPSDCFFNNGNL